MKFCSLRHGQKLWRHNFFSKNLFLRRPGIAIFAGIIKVVTTFIKKKSLKTQEKLEELEIMHLNGINICIFW